MRFTFNVLKRMARDSVKTSSPSLLGFRSGEIITGPFLAQVRPAAPGSEKKSPLLTRSAMDREKSEMYSETPETFGSSKASTLIVSLKMNPDAGISPTTRLLSAEAGASTVNKPNRIASPVAAAPRTSSSLGAKCSSDCAPVGRWCADKRVTEDTPRLDAQEPTKALPPMHTKHTLAATAATRVSGVSLLPRTTMMRPGNAR
mmetsp:Transcript_66482/g.137950  ORF Transcript_66482/g.137950 Transcript_66482/m.137950 type:complete len:202 (-) Transcript_66482:14-619(-)